MSPTPRRAGTAVEVLGTMNLAQIHVPYDQGNPRFHDLSDFGLGGFDLEPLDAAECPGGDAAHPGRRQTSSASRCRTRLRLQVLRRRQAQSSTLSLFSVSAIGAYSYVVAWNFDGDGAIRPEVGATGQLQMYSGAGARAGPWEAGRYAVAHMHNFYWRLDFDVAGKPSTTGSQELRRCPDAGRRACNRTPGRAFRTEASGGCRPARSAPGGSATWPPPTTTATRSRTRSCPTRTSSSGATPARRSPRTSCTPPA